MGRVSACADNAAAESLYAFCRLGCGNRGHLIPARERSQSISKRPRRHARSIEEPTTMTKKVTCPGPRKRAKPSADRVAATMTVANQSIVTAPAAHCEGMKVDSARLGRVSPSDGRIHAAAVQSALERLTAHPLAPPPQLSAPWRRVGIRGRGRVPCRSGRKPFV